MKAEHRQKGYPSGFTVEPRLGVLRGFSKDWQISRYSIVQAAIAVSGNSHISYRLTS